MSKRIFNGETFPEHLTIDINLADSYLLIEIADKVRLVCIDYFPLNENGNLTPKIINMTGIEKLTWKS